MVRFFVFIFSIIPFYLFAQTAADKSISIMVIDEPITDVLFRLSEISDVNITFSTDFFPKNKKISLKITDQPLKIALRKCLAGTEISYRLSSGGLILFKIIPKYYNLSGYLSDAQTGERLVGANIIEVNSLRGGASNAYGFYSQKFKQGKHRLQVSYLGYQTEIIDVDLSKTRQLNIALKPALTLEEITVISKKDSILIKNVGGETVLPLEWLSNSPQAGGEPDVLRYIQLLPGVQSGSDGFGGLHVRGGSSDQNLILLDDVPVYNPSHTFGLYSVFNPDLAKSVKFYKGGFPARYDGRLSSVLDVRTREGSDQTFSAELGIGTLASRAIVDIPLKRDKGGLLIAARRTHVDLWLPSLSANRKANGLEGQMNYRFFDINLKGHYSLGLKDKVYLSWYKGGDNFSDITTNEEEIDFEEDFGLYTEDIYATDWGNTIISLRWNHLFNDKLFTNTTFTFSDFNYRSNTSSLAQVTIFGEDVSAFNSESFYSSQITDYSVRTDFDYFLNENHHLRFGANLILRNFLPGFSESEMSAISLDSIGLEEFEVTFSDPNDLYSTEWNAYFEDNFTFDKLTINAGLHLSAFFSEERRDFIPQPRLQANYALTERLNLNASLVKTAQYLHLLTRADSGLPNDLWVPAGEETPPQEAWLYSLGLAGDLAQGRRWSIEGYYKEMANLLRFKPASAFSEEENTLLVVNADNREEIVDSGSGRAIGLEFLLEQQKGKFTGWLSYSFAKTTRNFNEQESLFLFDSRHSVTIAAIYRATKWLSFSSNWVYQSGRPLRNTDLTQNDIPFVDLLNEVPLLANATQLPAYHRWDIGINMAFSGKRLKHKLNLGVYNAYNRRNVFGVFSQRLLDGSDGVRVVGSSSLPILPSFNYSVQW